MANDSDALDKDYGIYPGMVINSQDPYGRSRLQVFLPHRSTTLFEGVNQKLGDFNFKTLDSDFFSPEILNRLKTNLPWAEPAMSVFGGSTGAPVNMSSGAPVPIPTDPANNKQANAKGASPNVTSNPSQINGAYTPAGVNTDYSVNTTPITPTSIILHDTSGNNLITSTNNGGSFYNYVIQNGTIYQIAPAGQKAQHAYQLNNSTIGIARVGVEGQPLSAADSAALSSLISDLSQHFQIPASNILTHPEAGPLATSHGGKDPLEANWKNDVLANSSLYGGPDNQQKDVRAVASKDGINNPQGEFSGDEKSVSGAPALQQNPCNINFPDLQTKGDAKAYLNNLISSNIDRFNINPTDAQNYGIDLSSNASKAQGITNLFVNMVAKESGWNSLTSSKEQFGDWSNGLMQMTTGNNYTCADGSGQSINSPGNIQLRNNPAMNLYSAVSNFANFSQKSSSFASFPAFFSSLKNSNGGGDYSGIADSTSLFRPSQADYAYAGGGRLPFHVNTDGVAYGDAGSIDPSVVPDGQKYIASQGPTPDGRNVMFPTNKFQNTPNSLNIGRAGGPVGAFGTAAPGSKVWVFFQDGNPQKPVYFAMVMEPQNAQAYVQPNQTSAKKPA